MHKQWGQSIKLLDHRLELFLAHYRKKSIVIDHLLIVVARYGPAMFFVEMFLLILFASSLSTTRNHAILAVIIAVLAAITTKLIVDPIAHRINRVRPFVRYQYEPLVAKAAFDPSFPSNHAGGALALATVLIYQFPNVSGLTLGLALLILVSRAYSGLHYLTDLVAGGLVGIVVAMIYLWLIG